MLRGLFSEFYGITFFFAALRASVGKLRFSVTLRRLTWKYLVSPGECCLAPRQHLIIPRGQSVSGQVVQAKMGGVSLHNRRFMRQARQTWHLGEAWNSRRWEEKKIKRLLPVHCPGSSAHAYANKYWLTAVMSEGPMKSWKHDLETTGNIYYEDMNHLQ